MEWNGLSVTSRPSLGVCPPSVPSGLTGELPPHPRFWRRERCFPGRLGGVPSAEGPCGVWWTWGLLVCALGPATWPAGRPWAPNAKKAVISQACPFAPEINVGPYVGLGSLPGILGEECAGATLLGCRLRATGLEWCSLQARGLVGPVVDPPRPRDTSVLPAVVPHLRSCKGLLRAAGVCGFGPLGAVGPGHPGWHAPSGGACCSPQTLPLGDPTRGGGAPRVECSWAGLPLLGAHRGQFAFLLHLFSHWLFGVGLRKRVRHFCWCWPHVGPGKAVIRSHLLCPAVLGGLASPLQAAWGRWFLVGDGPSGPAGGRCRCVGWRSLPRLRLASP